MTLAVGWMFNSNITKVERKNIVILFFVVLETNTVRTLEKFWGYYRLFHF